ncbi:MAG: hypothetical protein KKF10_08430, partial [Verrucomicrobia bacterium]|nr:hypothetical protein [Verrucomicrobiota bacterium]
LWIQRGTRSRNAEIGNWKLDIWPSRFCTVNECIQDRNFTLEADPSKVEKFEKKDSDSVPISSF